MFNFPLTKSSQQCSTARHCKTLMKSNIVSIGSYVWLFLLDFAITDCLLKLYMSVKSAITISCELYWEKCVYIGITSYGYLSVLRQYFATMQNLSSCGSPSDYGIEQGFSNYGNGNGLLFHMTQPTSRSTMKAIACSKPTISEN